MRTVSGVRMASSPNSRSAAGFEASERALLAVEDALDKPEHVSRAENDAERCENGGAAADLGKGARQDEELADKAREQRQADHGQGRNHKAACGLGHARGKAAIRGDERGRVAKFERAEEQEQSSFDDAGGEDLVNGSGPARESKAVDGQNDKAEMAEGGEGQQAPEVALHEGQAGSVEDADDGENNQKGRKVASLHRKESGVEAQQRVETELAGDNHGERDGSFGVCVGEPAMKRENRYLDGEGEKESERRPEERAGGERCRRRCGTGARRSRRFRCASRATEWQPAAARRG